MRRTKQIVKELIPAMMVTCGITYGIYIHSGYEKGRQEYQRLEDTYTSSVRSEREDSPELGPPDLRAARNMDSDSSSQESAGSGPALSSSRLFLPLAVPLPADAPPRKQVDWEALRKESPGVVGWITVPAVGISYPVMQAEDNDYYLHRDIYGNYLFAGAIFLDASCSRTMYGYNTIFYGHNMRDGSMFARLADFQDKSVWESCPYFWIQTPEADILYEIFSIHEAGSDSNTFTLHFSGYEELKQWQEQMTAISDPSTGISLEGNDRVVTLSTCTSSSAIRMTVQGRMVWRRDLEKKFEGRIHDGSDN